MRITEIKFRMNVEVAPFRHEHVEVTVAVDETDDPDEAFELARESARHFLGVDVTEDDVEQAEKTLAAARKAGLLK